MVSISGTKSFDRDNLVSRRLGKGSDGNWYFESKRLDRETLKITTVRHAYKEMALLWMVVTFIDMMDGKINI